MQKRSKLKAPIIYRYKDKNYFPNSQTFSTKTIKNIKMFRTFELQSLQFFHTTDLAGFCARFFKPKAKMSNTELIRKKSISLTGETHARLMEFIGFLQANQKVNIKADTALNVLIDHWNKVKVQGNMITINFENSIDETEKGGFVSFSPKFIKSESE